MFDKILVVCEGNICRSPIGERLLKKYTALASITSAGLNAKIGLPADAQAEKIANLHGLSLNGHLSKQLTVTLCKEHDLILVMENSHYSEICKIVPEVRGKIMLFGHWIDKRDIPDPYKKSDDAFRFVYQLIDDSAKKWAQAFNR